MLKNNGDAVGIKQYPDGRPAAVYRLDAVDEGIVMRHGIGPKGFDAMCARDVWVWEHDGTYFMHYDAADPEKGWLCALATSKDLRNWEKHGPVLDFGAPGEDDSAAAIYGVTYLEGDTWHLFYVASPNRSGPPDLLATFPYLTRKAVGKSPYGPWIKQKELIPFQPTPGTYYSTTASPGHIIKHNGQYLQFFSGSIIENDVIKRTIGIARTKDINGEWTVDPEPILPLEEQIENTSMFYEAETGTWFMFTNHVGIEEGIPEYTDAVWVYWTKNLEKWDPKNKAVVLDSYNCKWAGKAIGLPSVLRVGDRLAIFYDGAEGDSTSHCYRHVGLAWLDLPIKLPENR